MVCFKVPDLSSTPEAGSRGPEAIPAVMTAPAAAIPVAAAAVGFSKLKGVFKSFNGKVEVRVHFGHFVSLHVEAKLSTGNNCLLDFVSCCFALVLRIGELLLCIFVCLPHEFPPLLSGSKAGLAAVGQ